MTTLHPFERAGLGKAPFVCVAVRENWFSPPGFPEARKPGGCCNYCSTGILYEYVIKSSDGREFIVGSDCVRRTHAQVDGFRAARLKLARDKRETKRRQSYEERRAMWAAQNAERAATFQLDSTNRALITYLQETPDNAPEFRRHMAATLTERGYLTERQVTAVLGMAARDAQRQRDIELSQHVGEVGKRIAGQFEVVAVKDWENTAVWPPRTVYWHLLRLGTDLCTYKGSVRLGQRGDKVEAKFTVKEHDVYNGARQTKLARPAFPKASA